MRLEVLLGDCRDLLASMDAERFGACVTDPPYGLAFMGKDWDHAVPGVDYWREVIRVLKPGAPLLAFGGTRTYHRLACAIEDAGFVLRDCLSWLYGSGFPKSLDISKAIDRQRDDRAQVYEVTAWIRSARDEAGIRNRDIDAAFGTNGMAGHWTSGKSQPAVPTLEQVPRLLEVLGVAREDVPERIATLLVDLNGAKGQPGEAWFRREVIGTRRAVDTKRSRPGFSGATYNDEANAMHVINDTAPATEAARAWAGYGTALKPAWEPVILAMKPLDGTFAANALAHGVAGLNVDGARIEIPEGDGWDVPAPDARKINPARSGAANGTETRGRHATMRHTPNEGRFPANVLLDEDAAAALDAQAGDLGPAGVAVRRNQKPNTLSSWMGKRASPVGPDVGYGDAGGPSRFFYTAKASTAERDAGLDKRNTHPTVKPVDLMRYLVRLVKSPGALPVLDPFCGSGTTGVACAFEGVPFVGCELLPEHVEIARARIAQAEVDAAKEANPNTARDLREPAAPPPLFADVEANV